MWHLHSMMNSQNEIIILLRVRLQGKLLRTSIFSPTCKMQKKKNQKTQNTWSLPQSPGEYWQYVIFIFSRSCGFYCLANTRTGERAFRYFDELVQYFLHICSHRDSKYSSKMFSIMSFIMKCPRGVRDLIHFWVPCSRFMLLFSSDLNWFEPYNIWFWM